MGGGGQRKKLLNSPSSILKKASSKIYNVLTPSASSPNYIELFLSPNQKFAFSQYEENIDNKSLTNRVFYPFFYKLSQAVIPKSISPNVITSFGLLVLFQAWYVTNLLGYYDAYPVRSTWFVLVVLLMFFGSNSMDGIQAQRLNQTTALLDLYKYSCDTCSTVFVILLMCYCLGLDNVTGQWYAVQSAQLVMFTKHLSAFHRDAGLRYNVLTGPGEILTFLMGLLVVRATLGLDFLFDLYDMSLHKFVVGLERMLNNAANINGRAEIVAEKALLATEKLQNSDADEIIMVIYYIMYTVALVKIALLCQDHRWTKFGLLVSLSMRAVPAILKFDVNVVDVICDGLFMAVLTSDVTLAKMANREVHPWVVFMSFASTLSHSTILFLVLFYYCAVFVDLSTYLNLPLYSVCINVYCDGVFDLCHIGHKQLFQRALGYGNRLFVGVCNDDDCGSYKRPPVMTHDERCAEVLNCKSVTKVIPNAPCFGLTKEFIDKHQIHVVAFGQEYMDRYPNPDDDPYYAYPRKIGIAKPMPRHEGLSTSDLIKRIVARVEESKNGGSEVFASKAST